MQKSKSNKIIEVVMRRGIADTSNKNLYKFMIKNKHTEIGEFVPLQGIIFLTGNWWHFFFLA